jgi:hypothetical protein
VRTRDLIVAGEAAAYGSISLSAEVKEGYVVEVRIPAAPHVRLDDFDEDHFGEELHPRFE